MALESSELFKSINWEKIKERSAYLTERLLAGNLEQQTRASLQKELSSATNLLEIYQKIVNSEKTILELEQQKLEATQKNDSELAQLFDEELTLLKTEKIIQTNNLEQTLFPPDERNNKSVFLEIRAGTGGQEAALFAADLARMYLMYAQRKNWHGSVVDESPTDLGGFREIILHIQGKNVFGHLKFESGVHRVQRVPSTETSGRIHTSTATVVVLPELEESESVSINPADLRIDTYRAGGAGGQHVNKTDSAVRITHIPSGLVVACQDERSQHKNKAKALKILSLRLQNLEKEKHEADVSKQRREQVGTGMRAEKVRTYNFPQNRVSDHQVNVTLNKLDLFMNGDLDDIIEPLREHERIERRKQITY